MWVRLPPGLLSIGDTHGKKEGSEQEFARQMRDIFRPLLIHANGNPDNIKATTFSKDTSKQKPEVCEFCNKRKAVAIWTGTDDAMTQAHRSSSYPSICNLCSLEKQLEYCSKQAARISGIEMEIELLKQHEEGK